MANQTAVENNNVKGPSFEWWMISNIAIGAGFSAFVALLIPPYVTDVTGNATDAGVVMAIVSLAAVMGPILGGFADRYNAHRLITGLGILGTAVAFLMFSISAESNALYALDAILMGVSIAAVSAVAPVFIVGAGLPQALQAKRLTTFNLVAPVGQVLGGMMIGAAAAAGWAYNQRFFLAAAVIFICFIIFWFTSKKPAERILKAGPADEAAVKQTQKVGMKGVLFSNVYGIDEATTSGLISLAGLLNILFFFIAGAWMARKGSMPDFTTGNVMRFVGALGMAILGMAVKSPILIAVAFMQILYQGTPFIRLTQPVLAVRFATIPAGQAIGWVIGASAIGSFLGSVLGGLLADNVGFNAINWMGAIAAGIATLLIFISLWPAERKKRAEEAAAA